MQLRLLPVVAAALTLTGCTIPTEGAAAADRSAPAVPAPLLSAVPVAATGLHGRTVFLDPGHSGSHDAAITAQVPTGRGGTKDCQTTGTSTDDGYPEHTLAWQVVDHMRTQLESLGARVVLSRTDDTSVGSCVDERAAMANASGADAVVAVHADGAAPREHGFHVCYSVPPLNAVQTGPSVAFATAMRDAMTVAGFTPSTYVGDRGLQGRDDLAGLNLATRPSVLVELGNMRNPDEAREMTGDDGRARYARAVVAGITSFLGG
ncbi:Rv3717 family N-acetylmuramoyl-L-alanine amidase [Rhodococcus sp. NPDC127528]|uniref:Rv3717 family N-acetylmuramoyl-L-alanine amidase n=1 Tax=unclassified Rhodococcus (in: high G+C Gram-positive bacteria) TaxID=192944 RepID=UPI00363076DE